MEKRRLITNFKKTTAIFASFAMTLGMAPGTSLMANAAGGIDIGTPPVPVAGILVDGERYNSYATIQDAFEAAPSDECTIILYDDVTVGSDDTLTLNSDIGFVFLDLNGKTFTVEGTITGKSGAGISIQSETPGTFNSSGTVDVTLGGYTADTYNITGGIYNYFGIDGGTINISGGDFSNGIMFDNGGSADVAATISGNAKIKGLTYQPNSEYDYTASLTLTGGYYDVDPSSYKDNDTTESVTLDEDNIEEYVGQADWEADDIDPNNSENLLYKWRIKSSNSSDLVSLADATIVEIPDQTYTGNPIEPDLQVTLKGQELYCGQDYTVTYSNNVNCTMNWHAAKATITGIESYTGSLETGFNIVGREGVTPAVIEDAKVKLESFETGSINPDHFEGAVAGDVATFSVTFKKQAGIKRYWVAAFNQKDNQKGSKAMTGTMPDVVVVDSDKAYWDEGDTQLYPGPNGETITQTDTTITVGVKVVNPSDSSMRQSFGFVDGESIIFCISAQADDMMQSSKEVDVAVPFAATSVGKTYTVDGELVAEKKNIGDCFLWTANPMEYTGFPVEPKAYAREKDSGKYLTEGKDFTVKYSNNVNEGTGIATFTGINAYTGTATSEFQIVNLSKYNNLRPTLTSVTVNDIPLDSNGKVANGYAKVTFGFTIDPSVNEAEFYSEVGLTDGTTAIAFGPCTTVRPSKEQDASDGVKWVADPSAGANAFTYTATLPTLGVEEERIPEGEGSNIYVYGSKEGDKARFYGTSYINVDKKFLETKKGNYIEVPITKDSIGKTFTESKEFEDNKPDDKPAEAKSITGAEIKAPAQTYTGKALTPALEVKVDGTILKQGTDFDVTYTNNINAGNATAKITGKGNYKDSVDYKFTISPQKVTPKVTTSPKSFTYKNKAQKPNKFTVTANGKTLKINTDYTVSYSNKNSKNVGSYKVTVTCKGNYSGKATATYKIEKANNPIIVKAKKVTVKYGAKKIINAKNAMKVNKAQGKVTYKKAKGNSKITVAKNGKITVNKGLKKGTYNIKVTVKAAGNKNYKAGNKNVTIKIIVK